MSTSALLRARTRTTVGLILLAVLFVSTIMFTNLALDNWRLDLTEQKLYTVGEGTLKVLDRIEQPIQLYLFFSDQTTASDVGLRNYAARVRELLEEYAHYADGRLSLEVIHPESYSGEEERAYEFGLQALPAQNGESVFFGLVGTNVVDDVEIIEFFRPEREAFLEHDISQLIYSLTSPARSVVGLMTGLRMFGDFDLASQQSLPEWAIVEQMRKTFEVRQVDPKTTAIDPEIRVLMLVHPKGLSDAAWYAVDQFMMRGGRLFLFVDPYADKDPMFLQASNPTKAGGIQASDAGNLLTSLGLEVEMEMIASDRILAMPVHAKDLPLPVRHVGFLAVTPDTINRDSLLTSQLPRVSFAFASSIHKRPEFEGEFTSLIRTTKESRMIEKRTFRHLPDPRLLLRSFHADNKHLSLAAQIRVQPKTMFPDGPPEGAVEPPEGHRSEAAEPMDAVVVADSDMLADAMWVNVQNFFGQRSLNPWAGNGDFVLNVLDALSGSSDLIGLRGRIGFSRPFHQVDELRLQAQKEFRQKEQKLQTRLRDTEHKLFRLQQQKPEGEQQLLSVKQQQELTEFQEERLRINRELRSVRHELNRDIDALGLQLRVINIWLIPLLVTILALILWMMQRRRRGHRRTA